MVGGRKKKLLGKNMKYSSIKPLVKCHTLSEVFPGHSNFPVCSPTALGLSPYYSNDNIALELLVYMTVPPPSYGLVEDKGNIFQIVSLVPGRV